MNELTNQFLVTARVQGQAALESLLAVLQGLRAEAGKGAINIPINTGTGSGALVNAAAQKEQGTRRREKPSGSAAGVTQPSAAKLDGAAGALQQAAVDLRRTEEAARDSKKIAASAQQSLDRMMARTLSWATNARLVRPTSGSGSLAGLKQWMDRFPIPRSNNIPGGMPALTRWMDLFPIPRKGDIPGGMPALTRWMSRFPPPRPDTRALAPGTDLRSWMDRFPIPRKGDIPGGVTGLKAWMDRFPILRKGDIPGGVTGLKAWMDRFPIPRKGDIPGGVTGLQAWMDRFPIPAAPLPPSLLQRLVSGITNFNKNLGTAGIGFGGPRLAGAIHAGAQAIQQGVAAANKNLGTAGIGFGGQRLAAGIAAGGQRLAGGFNAARQGVANAWQGVRTTATAFGSLAVAHEQPYGNLQGFAAKMKSVFYYSIAAGIIYGTVAGIRRATQEMFKFEYEIAKIRGFFDDRSLNVKLLIEKGTIQAAKDFGTALAEVVQVTKLFAQAGYSPKESIAQTRAVLRASSGLDIAPGEAAQTAIAVREIGKGRVSSEDIFERIARVERLNAVSAEDLNTAIQRVGGFLTQLQPKAKGVVDGFDLVIGATTQIVEQTRVSGNTAANALKFFVARLSAPEIAASLQEQFGIRLAANKEGTEFRPLIEIMQSIAETYMGLKAQSGGSGDIRAQELLATIAGARQIALAEALFSNWDKVMQVAGDSTRAYGDLQSRLNLQMDTVIRQTGKLGAAFVGFLNELAGNSGIFAAVKATLRGLTSVVSGLSEGSLSTPLGALPVGSAGPAFGVIGAAFAGSMAQKLMTIVGSGKEAGTGVALLHKIATATAGRNTQIPITDSRLIGALAKGWAAEGSAVVAGAATGTGFAVATGAAPKGIKILGGILSAIATTFGSFTPLAVIGGLLALAALIKWLIDRNQKLPPLEMKTFPDINETDFGKEVIERARLLGTTPYGLTAAVGKAQATAQVRALAIAQAEALKPEKTRNKDLAELAKPGVLDAVMAGTLKNRAISALLEQEFSRALFSGFAPADVQLLIGEKFKADGRIPASQVGWAQQLLRQTIQYTNAPSEDYSQQVVTRAGEVRGMIEKLQESPAGWQRFMKGTTGPAPAAWRPGRQAIVEANPARTLGLAVGELIPQELGFNLEGLVVATETLGPNMDALSVATEAVKGAFGNAERGLNNFLTKFYTPAGGLAPDTIARNKAALEQKAYTTIRNFIVGTTPTATSPTDLAQGLTSGARVLADAFSSALIRASKDKLALTPEQQERAKLVQALSQKGPEYMAKMATEIDVLATARDRVGQIIVDIASKFLEIKAITPAFQRLGLAFNPLQENIDTAIDAMRQLSAVPVILEGDVLKRALELSQLQGGGVVGMAAFRKYLDDATASQHVDQLDESGEPGDTSPRDHRSRERAVANARHRLELVRDMAAKGAFLDEKVLQYANPADVKLLQKVLQGALNVDITDERQVLAFELTLRSMLEALERGIIQSGRDVQRGQQRVIERTKAEHAVAQQNLQLNQHLIASQARMALQTTRRRFGPLATFGQEAAAIGREQGDTVQTAQQRYQQQRKMLELEAALRPMDKIELDAKQAELTQQFANTVGEAYNSAMLGLVNLMADAESQILDRTQESIRQLISEGLSGLTEVLKNPGQLFQGKPSRTAQMIIAPIGNTILSNTVDNLMRTLVGPGGAFEQQLGAFFGFNEEIRKNAELKQLHTDAVYEGTLHALKEAGLADPAAGRVPGGVPGMARMLSSIGVPSVGIALGSVLRGPNKGAVDPKFFTPGAAGLTAAGAGIMGGGYSPTGPNAGAKPRILAEKQAAAAAAAQNKASLAEQRKAYLKTLAGTMGGAILGGVVGGKGIRNSYSAEGASIGAGIGSLIPGVGTVVGGLVGGLLGGLFGKPAPPKPPRTPKVLELIERNTRTAAEALDNQNRMLFNLDSRLLNIPATFAVPAYRPQGVDGQSAGAFNASYTFNITGGNAQEIAGEVQKVLQTQDRLRGGFTSMRRGN